MRGVEESHFKDDMLAFICLLSVSAQLPHLYVFGMISSSHLEKVAFHVFILIVLYVPGPLPQSFTSFQHTFFSESGHSYAIFPLTKPDKQAS